ncbi:[protein release factor]-glutamine N5-methyltransferase [Methylovorus glucosotrophus]|uniref:peptide chain release factor N(5)-glutamine methyltransferase n=1 Tax=Methylovorus glucosotrophus TaxID=266009 RepID=UPI00133188B5|nr:peptide chain release factor N(5)-glutamine methyltransferase [Methylovorus glucosotrophus]KAF0842981.1 [protein release factor]-glutamine N5-methyltransferase [Methylovorus glucosotrophus]
MSTIQQALREAQQQLGSRLNLESREARNEARMLMSQALGNVEHAWLIAHESDALPSAVASAFHDLLHRRLAGEPVAYILGNREFFGLRLAVSPATLIPRPDTETLVEAALARIPREEPRQVLDLGTGTGAIALAIAAHRPQSRVIAVDASAAALQVARQNAEALGLAITEPDTHGITKGNVEFRLGSWFTPLADLKFDVIVSNPPYIRMDDPHLQQGDLRHEPLSALASGADGLDDIRIIVQHAPAHLQPSGWLLLEHGYDQADAVATLMRNTGFSDVQHAHDLAGIARVTLGQWTG